jgi:hypothetical protein
MSNTLTPSTYTIEVGTPGQFTQDENVDISETLNAELKAIPNGAQINVIFNPGDYGELSTILLPSNTSVIGEDAELNSLVTNTGSSPNGSALISNAGAYCVNNNSYIENLDGTYTEIPYNSIATPRIVSTYNNLIINTNISVSGLTFNETGLPTNGSSYQNVDPNTFGTWFTNCTNISITNNVYIGGNDGNAFVNVDNGVVSNNIAVGNLCAFDNWNGTSNITIEDNQVWQKSVDDNDAFAAIQINSTPNGNPVSNGDITNVAVISNSIAGNTIWQSALNANPLLFYGQTSESNITVNGNIETSLGGYTQGFYVSGPITNVQISDNVVTGESFPAGASGVIGIYGPTVNFANVSGNLIVDSSIADENTPMIVVTGSDETTLNNVTSIEKIYNQATSTADSVPGAQIIVPTLLVEVPNEIYFSDMPQQITSIIALDDTQSPTLNVEVSVQLGSISSITNSGTNIQVSGENVILFTGSIGEINTDLSTLIYTPAKLKSDDSVKIYAWDQNGNITTSYIPLLNTSLNSNIDDVVTIASGFIAPTDPFANSTSLEVGGSPPTLSGDVLIAASGNNLLNLEDSTSIAYLGTGENTVIGGSLSEYISAGTGTSVASLTGSGNTTFVGGTGSSTIDALTGSDVIEGASGSIDIIGGSSALTIIGGSGSLDYHGGTSATYITTLPQNSGNSDIQLGTGNSTVEAFSGNNLISSELGTENDMILGSGNNLVISNGEDFIYSGVGSDTIEVGLAASDTVIGGGGLITIADNKSLISFSGIIGVQYIIPEAYQYGDVLSSNVFSGPLLLTSGNSSINTLLYSSVTDTTGDNLLTVGGASVLNVVAGNDVVQVVDSTNLINSSISGAEAVNTINFGINDFYQGCTTSFVSTLNILNLRGNDAAVVYAANQDTVNLSGVNNTLVLEQNKYLLFAAAATSVIGGSSVINVNGTSTALVETSSNSITGANGALLYVSGGDNSVTGQDLDVLVSGAGNTLVLTGSATVVSASPYTYQSLPSQLLVQNQMTVQGGQFTLGGLDTMDQLSGTAAISLFGGNKVTLGGANDSVSVSDQIYGGNAITNAGAGNVLTVLCTSYASTTISAVTSTLVNVADNTGSIIGHTNDNLNERLSFIGGSGTSNTIYGASSNTAITLFGGQSANDIVYGGAMGGNSLNGGIGGGDFFKAGGTGDILIGGSAGNNTLVSATGLETLIGAGLGNDAFSITGGGGTDIIQNFKGHLTVDAALTVTSETVVSGSTMLTLSDHTQISFLGLASVVQTGNVFTL